MLVYKATNQINSKVYIGITSQTLAQRLTTHRYDVKRQSNTKFHRALNKYGFDSFIFEVIDTANSVEDLFHKEQHYINTFDSMKNGYNSTLGGEGTFGREMPLEQRLELSKSRRGKSMRGYGWNHSEETKRKMSVANTGKIRKPKFQWIVYHPNGDREIVYSIYRFCKDHNMSTSGAYEVAGGKLPHYKKFRFIKTELNTSINQQGTVQ